MVVMNKQQRAWIQNSTIKLQHFTQEWSLLQRQSLAIMSSLENQISQLGTLSNTQDPSKLGVLAFFGDFEKLLFAKYVQYFEILMKSLLKNMKEFEEIVLQLEILQIESSTVFKEQKLDFTDDHQKQETLQIADILECLLLMLSMFENEFWVKKEILGKIRYTMGKEIEFLYQDWVLEQNILPEKVSEILENLKGL